MKEKDYFVVHLLETDCVSYSVHYSQQITIVIEQRIIESGCKVSCPG